MELDLEDDFLPLNTMAGVAGKELILAELDDASI
jgi:hypothetical protein